MTKVTAELSENEKYILVWFRFSPGARDMIEKAKSVPSWKFVNDEKAGPEVGAHWRYRADIDTARIVRHAFGDALVLSPRLKKWGTKINADHNRLQKLGAAGDAELTAMPNSLPELCDWINGNEVEDVLGNFRTTPTPQGRPYQRADIKFLAQAANPLNANQPGLGKTVEAIGAVYEEEIEEGPKLVICPRLSVFNVWAPSLEAWTGEPVLATTGSSRDKLRTLREAKYMFDNKEPFWLVVNWSMVRLVNSNTVDENEDPIFFYPYDELWEIDWNIVIADEFHREGLANKNSVTRMGLDELKSVKRHGMSGTPVRGNPMKLWGVLNWLEPQEFSSKWRFAEQWLEVEEVEYGRDKDEGGKGKTKHKKVHGIRKDRESAFYEMLSRYMVRRTKREVLPWLPPKQYPDPIWVEMSPRQKKQYDAFAMNAEVKIEEEKLSATSILGEYARLKQFANAYCTIKGTDRDGRPIVVPTEESPKLEALMEILMERGIGQKDDVEDAEVEQQVCVFTQFSRMADMVYEYLEKKKIKVGKITGPVSEKQREEYIRQFQEGGNLQVMVMTTTAGGVSIDLDMADTVVFLDETWTPDDQEQAEDRVHRGSRLHQVTVFYIRTKGTIEQYILETNVGKSEVNSKILDLHRAGFRAVK